MGWWQTWKSARRSQVIQRRAIPEALWCLTLARYGFLERLDGNDRAALRELATLFLADKEFHGAGGLHVDDAMAVAIAAQACLPVLRLGLGWYSGFKGIVVHADAVLAQREFIDDTGVVHEYEEELSGEAMEGGPVMLSWRDVEDAGESADWGYNVVIHEFAHVLDMRDGAADGVPPLPDRAARQRWLAIVEAEYSAFCAAVDEGIDTLLDPYGAESTGEFFAVAAESFFTTPQDMQAAHPALYELLAHFFRQDPAGALHA
jgi:Mlc titration factor MtfA (ptsG expression regulator)